MANKRKQFTEEQRRDALQYLADHPDLSIRQCAENLGIGYSTLHRFKAQAKNSPDGDPKFPDPVITVMNARRKTHSCAGSFEIPRRP